MQKIDFLLIDLLFSINLSLEDQLYAAYYWMP